MATLVSVAIPVGQESLASVELAVGLERPALQASPGIPVSQE